jgi:2-polyprenyl-6-methoxyphenol hydroxylase-like FAD-dependent oxidoreductase
MWGHGRRFGIVPMTKNRVHCFASINTHDPESLRNYEAAQVRSLFAEFGGKVPYLLEHLSDDSHLMFSRIEEVEVRNWVQGRAVLIGDAAHGMTPNLTQGASQAIEDAVCLSNAFRGIDNVHTSLASYASQRRNRVSNIQRRSRLMGKIGQWRSPLLTSFRNYCWKNIPDKWIQKDFENLVISSLHA